MNIFFIFLDPTDAARHHGDKHVIKMILESTQMLMTCCHVAWGESTEWIDRFKSEVGCDPYRKAFVNHPCTVWVRQCVANFNWLCDLAAELCEEKERRWPTGPPHVCKRMIAWLRMNPPPLPASDMITPPNKAMATPDAGPGRSLSDSLVAYRSYYQHKANLGIVFYRRAPERTPHWLFSPLSL